MTYPGGKNGSGVYQKIINQLPPHRVYIEGFLGHGAIMRYKRPAEINVGIDRDPAVLAAWRSGTVANGDTVHRQDITLINGDAISWIKENFYKLTPDTLIYLDPPYLFDVRSSKRSLYTCEMGDEAEHRAMIEAVIDAPCMVAISGYRSALYDKLLHTWRTVTYNTTNRAGKPVTEWLWLNYPEPQALHDYRYLGENFRERERITRQKKRWIKRLERMDTLQRYALTAAIAEMSEPAASQ